MKYLALLVLLPSAALAQGFERKELRVPGTTLHVTEGDLDGDGRVDLVVSYRRGSGPTAARYLAVFFRDEDGYPPRPQAAFAAPRNAAVFDVGDAVGDGADEIVYLTPTGVFAQAFRDRKPGNPTRVIEVDTLVGEPEEDDLLAWDFLRRIPGGGEVALVPSPRRLNLYRRKGPLFQVMASLDIRQHNYYDAESRAYRRSRRGGSSGRPFAFRVVTVVPSVTLVDQTGDGRPDVVATFEDRVAVYPQTAEGTFAAAPTFERWFAVQTPEQLESGDVEVTAHVQDLDGDGIADLVLTKIGGGITTLETEVRIHAGLKGGGFAEAPAQTFADKGYAALSAFVDVDGDGKLEMLHPHAEVSIMSMSRAMLSSELALDVRIRRRGEGPTFERAAVQTIDTRYALDLSVGATLHGGAPMFGHDFDGDGVPDLVAPQGGERMRLHRGRRGESRPFEAEGKISLVAPGSHQTHVLYPDVAGRGRPGVLVYYVSRKKLGGVLYHFDNAFE